MTDLVVAALRLCAALAILLCGWRPVEELPGWLAHRATRPWIRLAAAVDRVAAPLRRLRLRRVDGPGVLAAGVRLPALLGLLVVALRAGGAPDVFALPALHAWLLLCGAALALVILVAAAQVARRWQLGARLALIIAVATLAVLLVVVPALT